MNIVKSNEEAQMMTLEALIASLMIIVAVLFVVSQIPSHVQLEVDDSEVQLRYYGEDAIAVLKESPSPDEDYDNLLQYYISEEKYSELDDFLNNSLPKNVGYDVSLVFGSDKEELTSHGYSGGERIVVSEVVVSKDVSIGGIPGAYARVKKVTKTFPAGSLIIPMDDYWQPDPHPYPDDNYIPLLRGMGLVYQITNGTYSDGKPISVWQLLEDPRGEDYTLFFSLNVNTSDNPRDISSGDNESRKYGGGPYVIDANDLTPAIKDKILSASENSPVGVGYHVEIHQTLEELYHHPAVEMKMAPKIAAYPPDDWEGWGENNKFYSKYPPNPYYESKLIETLGKYYIHSTVPYVIIDDTMIKDGILEDIDIITIPHADLSPMSKDVAEILIEWLSNGGTIHAECKALVTLDAKVEEFDNGNHPWIGFIGVSNTLGTKRGRAMVFVGNSSIETDDNINYYGLYQEPGAFQDVLSQSGDSTGVLIGAGWSAVPAFKFTNYSMINPDASVLAGAGVDRSSSAIDISQMTYISAPFDRGMVTYLAGHDMSEDFEGTPTPHKERLMFHTFFYPGFGTISDYGVAELQITMWYK